MLINLDLNSIIDRAKQLLEKSKYNGYNFFYAALEIRFAIEKFLKDWLDFTIRGSHPLSEYIKELYGENLSEIPPSLPENKKVIDEFKRSDNIYSVKDFQSKILSLAPFFEKRIEFMTILEPIFGTMKAPDFKLLNKYYGRVGAYLHLPKSNFIEKNMLEELHEIIDYLEENSDLHRCFISLTEEGEILFNKFINNELTDDELKYINENGSNYHNGGIYRFPMLSGTTS